MRSFAAPGAIERVVWLTHRIRISGLPSKGKHRMKIELDKFLAITALIASSAAAGQACSNSSSSDKDDGTGGDSGTGGDGGSSNSVAS